MIRKILTLSAYGLGSAVVYAIALYFINGSSLLVMILVAVVISLLAGLISYLIGLSYDK